MCPSELIKITSKKLKEVMSLITLFPKINWNSNGENKRRNQNIIYTILFFFISYLLSKLVISVKVAYRYGHGKHLDAIRGYPIIISLISSNKSLHVGLKD